MLSLLNPPYSGVFQIQTMRTFGELARTWRIVSCECVPKDESADYVSREKDGGGRE